MVRSIDPWEIKLQAIADERGVLSVIDRLADDAFVPKRIFFVSDVSPEISRGAHAHKKSWQLLSVANGSASVTVHNKEGSYFFELRSNSNSLCVPPLNWLEFKMSSRATTLIVLTSENYDINDYIYDKQELK